MCLFWHRYDYKAAGDHGPNMLQTLLPENSDDCKEPTEDDKLNVRLQDSGTCGIKVIKKLEGSIIVNRNQTMGKEISPLDFDASDKGSVEADHESQHVAENIASKKTEVLWNGSFQLTSSISVSTIAYFKSGEKVPDNWSNNIEVKGKVKLEAFEKFIKEFRCSRNRSLMVISLCWKAGSSRSGLAGMKERNHNNHTR
ncbi:hypothetical protein QJS10_CPA05g01385 [Acorus calamus]|uniref:Spen paralogue and orthologue SPOC C-terminal domain-containing protein n=1 Tax=Acorus calamus TaxID=4465 RepID=A0AAV9ET33_ACOCL|nr:hypothetical protein QJS10_CPA05g01385 [Acorus calamus]